MAPQVVLCQFVDQHLRRGFGVIGHACDLLHEGRAEFQLVLLRKIHRREHRLVQRKTVEALEVLASERNVGLAQQGQHCDQLLFAVNAEAQAMLEPALPEAATIRFLGLVSPVFGCRIHQSEIQRAGLAAIDHPLRKLWHRPPLGRRHERRWWRILEDLHEVMALIADSHHAQRVEAHDFPQLTRHRVQQPMAMLRIGDLLVNCQDCGVEGFVEDVADRSGAFAVGAVLRHGRVEDPDPGIQVRPLEAKAIRLAAFVVESLSDCLVHARTARPIERQFADVHAEPDRRCP